MNDDFVVKFPGRLRSQIEEVARQEFLPVPDTVRQLVQKAMVQRQLERSKHRDQNDR
jgi:hypothetical protein